MRQFLVLCVQVDARCHTVAIATPQTRIFLDKNWYLFGQDKFMPRAVLKKRFVTYPTGY
jgi:hypothetical protein